MGKLTTHVLDTANGRPAAGIRITCFRVDGQSLVELAVAETNADGRCDTPLLEGAQFQGGVYQLHFEAGSYFDRISPSPEPRFVDVAVLRFGIADAGQHFHVPLLVSPFSYSTYRGS